MQEPYRKNLASYPDPESCDSGRKATGEALTGAHAGQPLSCVIVPDQILIAVFPELRLYGFRRAESWFPKLLSILEEGGATGLGESAGALRSVGMGLG